MMQLLGDADMPRHVPTPLQMLIIKKHRPGGARAAWAMALVWSEPEDGSGVVTLGGVGATVE